MENYSDEMLVWKVLNGDEYAFGFLVDRYKGAVHTIAYHKIGNFQDAEDITQEVFLKAYQKLSTLKEPARLSGWLYCITSNCCKMFLRKKKKERELTIPLENLSHSQLSERSFADYEKARRRGKLHDAMDLLADTDRLVLTLYYMGGTSCAEIGKLIGASANAVRNRLYHARRRLKLVLEGSEGKEMIGMMEQIAQPNQLEASFTIRLMEKLRHIKPIAPAKPYMPWLLPIGIAIVVALFVGIGLMPTIVSIPPFSLSGSEETVPVELIFLPQKANSPIPPVPVTQAMQATSGQKETEKPGDLQLDTIVAGIKHYDSLVKSAKGYVIRETLNAEGKRVENGASSVELPNGWWRELRAECWLTFDGTENLRYDITVSPTEALRFHIYYEKVWITGVGGVIKTLNGKHEGEEQPFRYSVRNRSILEGYDTDLDPRFWYGSGGRYYLSFQTLHQWLVDHQAKVIGKEKVDGELCYVLEDTSKKYWIAPEKGFRVLKTKQGYYERRIFYRKYGKDIWFPQKAIISGPNVYGWDKGEKNNKRVVTFKDFKVNEDVSPYFHLDIRPDEWVLDDRGGWVLDDRGDPREFRRAINVLGEEFFQKMKPADKR